MWECGAGLLVVGVGVRGERGEKEGECRKEKAKVLAVRDGLLLVLAAPILCWCCCCCGREALVPMRRRRSRSKGGRRIKLRLLLRLGAAGAAITITTMTTRERGVAAITKVDPACCGMMQM
jgi:hypothetical protein